MTTKTKIIENVAAKTGMKKKDAEAAVNAVIASLEDAFVAGEKVQIAGFGTFEVKERAARVGRNPRTGAAMTIEASKHLSFTAGKTIKDAINK
ncbi:MAG: HU family DNA-binding protein [Clostridia bacterium]|nr:HU family DNA-binding protein [Clostridia bacterium]MBQ4574355.1 HU family DNA-binding protein [Clostridia bacterium]